MTWAIGILLSLVVSLAGGWFMYIDRRRKSEVEKVEEDAKEKIKSVKENADIQIHSFADAKRANDFYKRMREK